MKRVEINKMYTLYEDGSLFSKFSNRFINSDKSNRFGYLRVTMYYPQRQRHLLHRLVAANFLERPEGCDFVNHIDGNKLNNAASNLEWVTQSDNEKHAFRTHLKPTRACRYIDRDFNSVQDLANHLHLTHNVAYYRCGCTKYPDYCFIERATTNPEGSTSEVNADGNGRA